MRPKLQIRRYLLTGLISILPLWITLGILWVVFKWIGGLTRPFMSPLFSTDATVLINLISFLLTLVVIYIIGFLATHLVSRRILTALERAFTQIPLMSGVYMAARRLTQYLFTIRREYRKVALIEYPRKGLYAIGFVTSDTKFIDIEGKRMLNVFVPTAPNPTSGVLVVVPEAEIIQLNMKIDEAIRLIISGGIIQPEKR